MGSYIKNPNGASVVALIKTTPASQIEGFRDLFADYITPTPEPKFILRQSVSYENLAYSFVVSAHI